MPSLPAPKLRALQEWFASIITRPIDNDSQMLPLAPSGRPMAEEAAEFISPGIKLTSDQRLQIYNQQYWWRMLANLHLIFPTVVRLFGYTDFNRALGMPYLARYPSRHWSITKLGDALPRWIEEEYTADDKPLVFWSAQLDLAYQTIFYAPAPRAVTVGPELLSKKAVFQPHLRLFKLPFDLFSFRANLLKEKVEFWLENDFPQLQKKADYFFALYRTTSHSIVYKEIQAGQWALLDAIERGLSLAEACDALEIQSGAACAEAHASMALWLQDWLRHHWLSFVT